MTLDGKTVVLVRLVDLLVERGMDEENDLSRAKDAAGAPTWSEMWDGGRP